MFDSYAKLLLAGKAYKATVKTNKNDKKFVSISVGVTEKVDGKWGKEFYNLYYYTDRAEKIAANVEKNKPFVSAVCKPIFNEKKINGFFVEELAIPNDWDDAGTTTATPVPPPAVEEDDDNDLPF